MNAHDILKEIQRQFDLSIELGDLQMAAEIIDFQNTEAARKQLDTDIETSFQDLLISKFSGDTGALARVLYRYFVKLAAAAENKRQASNSKTKAGRPPKEWGEDGEYKLMVYEGVNRELDKMKSEGLIKPKVVAAIERMNPNMGKTRAEKREHDQKNKNLQSAYSEAKSMLNKEK